MTTKLEQLEQQQAKVKKQIQAEKTKQRKKARAQETRQKILLGALELVKMRESETYKAQKLEELGKYLTRPHDRAQFGLEPLEETAEQLQEIVGQTTLPK